MPRQKKEADPGLRRFWVKAPEALYKRLAHLAIDKDETIEKLGGQLLAKAIDEAEREQRAQHVKR